MTVYNVEAMEINHYTAPSGHGTRTVYHLSGRTVRGSEYVTVSTTTTTQKYGYTETAVFVSDEDGRLGEMIDAIRNAASDEEALALLTPDALPGDRTYTVRVNDEDHQVTAKNSLEAVYIEAANLGMTGPLWAQACAGRGMRRFEHRGATTTTLFVIDDN